MTKEILPDGTLKAFHKLTNIPIPHLSAYLSDKRTMSKKRSELLALASCDLGYDFSAADWMFSPSKIKNRLMGKETNSPKKDMSTV